MTGRFYCTCNESENHTKLKVTNVDINENCLNCGYAAIFMIGYDKHIVNHHNETNKHVKMKELYDEGYAHKEIAKILNCTLGQVQYYLTNKLGLRSNYNVGDRKRYHLRQ